MQDLKMPKPKLHIRKTVKKNVKKENKQLIKEGKKSLYCCNCNESYCIAEDKNCANLKQNLSSLDYMNIGSSLKSVFVEKETHREHSTGNVESALKSPVKILLARRNAHTTQSKLSTDALRREINSSKKDLTNTLNVSAFKPSIPPTDLSLLEQLEMPYKVKAKMEKKLLPKDHDKSENIGRKIQKPKKAKTQKRSSKYKIPPESLLLQQQIAESEMLMKLEEERITSPLNRKTTNIDETTANTRETKNEHENSRLKRYKDTVLLAKHKDKKYGDSGVTKVPIKNKRTAKISLRNASYADNQSSDEAEVTLSSEMDNTSADYVNTGQSNDDIGKLSIVMGTEIGKNKENPWLKVLSRKNRTAKAHRQQIRLQQMKQQHKLNEHCDLMTDYTSGALSRKLVRRISSSVQVSEWLDYYKNYGNSTWDGTDSAYAVVNDDDTAPSTSSNAFSVAEETESTPMKTNVAITASTAVDTVSINSWKIPIESNWATRDTTSMVDENTERAYKEQFPSLNKRHPRRAQQHSSTAVATEDVPIAKEAEIVEGSTADNEPSSTCFEQHNGSNNMQANDKRRSPIMYRVPQPMQYYYHYNSMPTDGHRSTYEKRIRHAIPIIDPDPPDTDSIQPPEALPASNGASARPSPVPKIEETQFQHSMLSCVPPESSEYKRLYNIGRSRNFISAENVPEWNYTEASTPLGLPPPFNDPNYIKLENMALIGMKLILGNSAQFLSGFSPK